MSKNTQAIVVGCGVAGLSCGIRLLQEGFKVRILACDIPPNTTSDTATALWYPYNAYPADRVLGWGKFSYEKFESLCAMEGAGVSFVELAALFGTQVGDPWWIDAVKSFRYAGSDELPDQYVSAYLLEVPLIEVPIYMEYLVQEFIESGGVIEKLETRLDSLDDLYGQTSLLINCSGIGAKILCNDNDVYPIRGQVVRISNPGIDRSYLDEDGPLALSYVFVRSNDCVLGGTAQENDWNLEVDQNIAADIIDKCSQIYPSIKDSEVLNHVVGLRPGRKQIRLESEHIGAEDCWVIHNYGHGGAGFTLSWGCAEEVTMLANGVRKLG